MNLIAHSGVEHSSIQEAAAHNGWSVLLTVVLITAAVGAMLTVAIYLLHRFSSVQLPIKEENEE